MNGARLEIGANHARRQVSARSKKPAVHVPNINLGIHLRICLLFYNHSPDNPHHWGETCEKVELHARTFWSLGHAFIVFALTPGNNEKLIWSVCGW